MECIIVLTDIITLSLHRDYLYHHYYVILPERLFIFNTILQHLIFRLNITFTTSLLDVTS